ncbi:bromodomain-containing protein DDB_G0270170 isoform X2 [Sitodiplosis mosellana]|uniref:bromodomain-containing protein DDB_G0270170 isoform X2 n=1 Tax=Sitodiplosis mosellana TaxID=263140 RepID=UPI002443DE70|nr:bromodomain-containing protein DDB_G0270170 isoform X2 [Sitodiplosis mosellana]
MSDRCKKSTKLSAKKKKYQRCQYVMNEGNSASVDDNNAIVKNQMATSMQKFCIDSNIMLNTARKCSITESHKRRRRFHPLRNLRRIFRRRTLAHADAIRPIVQQHQNYYHQNEGGHQQYPGDLTNVSTIRSLSAQSIDDDVLPDDLSDFQSSHLIRSANQSNLLAATKRAYYYAKDGAGKRLIHSGGAGGGGVMDLDTETDSDLTREMIDYQRSLSEGRLLDNDFSRETLSHSHDSVFSESATASSLSIVLKAELADALRKRKSRSDASDEDLGLPRSPSTPPRNGSHHVVDGQMNSTNNVGRHQHHSSLGLLSMASSEIYDDSMESSSFLSTSKSSYEIGKHDDIFPPEISLNSSRDSDTRLSHSAAKHKMAIRPKKKGPSRPPRKPTDTSNALPSMPEVNEDFLKSSNVIESYVNKSQSLPRGVTSITTSKTIEKHSNVSTTLNKQTKSRFGKTLYTSGFDGRDQKDVSDSNKSVLPSITKTDTRTLDSKREERTHSEEGFFRRFINRSGRKQKKERETSTAVDTDTLDVNKTSKKMETSTPAIKKSAELSIINVLSNVRANDMPIGAKSSYLPSNEINKSPKSLVMKNDKLRSGPISRQRYTKEIMDIEKTDPIETHSPQKLSPHSTRKEFATSYLRFSPTKSIQSQCDDESDSFVRTSHHRSEEMLNTATVSDPNAFNDVDEDTPAPYSVSLPKSVWPSENKFPQNVSRNGYGWGQCQQKISKLSGDQQQQHQIKSSSQTKGKMVEKSKSFRLYTKNFNNETTAQTRNESSKPSLCPSLPDLNASNRSPLARPSRYSSNRENLQSLRYLNNSGNNLNANANANANAKWTPTRSSSSSRISEQRYSNNRFEINDMNLIPTSKLYSTLNTSDEIASYDIEKDDTHLMPADQNPNLLQSVASSKTHHSIQNTNINEIEDNIDKIMKSSVVTVLKKSPTAELYQIKTNNGNVSLTTITKDDHESNGLNVATVENPPLLRHSTTATKLDLQVPSSSPPKKIISDIPEFMQIQLNRVDASRPKSCIEYSSTIVSSAVASNNNNATASSGPNEEDKERRFSNESIEISDKKKAISSSSMNAFNSNLNKSSESLKSGFGHQSRSSIGSQQLSRGSSTSDLNKTSIISDNHSSDDCLDLDLDDDNEGHLVIERRKSVSDKKLKFEQQIEKIQAEVKRSSIIGADKGVTPRKLSLEDDNSSTVVLRGKKSAKSSESADPTPELMKVFARRSLKIKDTDEYQVHDDAERELLNQKMNDSGGGGGANNDTNNNMNRINNAKNSNRFNTDSDKENNVSSGAQSSIPKVEIYIKPTNDKSGDASPKKDASIKNNVDMTSVKSIGKLFNGATANRFSSNPSNTAPSNNYRNSTAFFENLHNSPNNPAARNQKDAAPAPQDNGVVLIIEKNQGNNNENVNNSKFNSNSYNNNFTKNTTPIISNKIGQIQSSMNQRNSNEDTMTTTNVNSTKTTGTVSNNSADANNSSQDIDHKEKEYKGILERKAEWEKRASQAFK